MRCGSFSLLACKTEDMSRRRRIVLALAGAASILLAWCASLIPDFAAMCLSAGDLRCTDAYLVGKDGFRDGTVLLFLLVGLVLVVWACWPRRK